MRIEGVGRAEVGQLAGDAADRVLQVQRVGQVQLPGHQRGAGEAHLVRLDREVPPVRRRAAPLFGLLRHEPADRLIDDPVELDRADLVRHRRHLHVHEPRRLDAEGTADGFVGDPPGLPRRQVTALDSRPQSGEPVAQFQGVTQVVLPGLGAHRDRGRELRHTELPHQRCAGSGQGDRLLIDPREVDPGGVALRIVEGLRGMDHRPLHRRLQQPSFGQVGRRPLRAGEPQHPGGIVRHRGRIAAGSTAGSWAGAVVVMTPSQAPGSDTSGPNSGFSTSVRITARSRSPGSRGWSRRGRPANPRARSRG